MWALEGESIEYTYTSYGITTEKTAWTRDCISEDSTKQYLGQEGKFSDADRAKANKDFTNEKALPYATDWKIVRHFRY